MTKYAKKIKYLCIAVTMVLGLGSFAAHAYADTDFMTSWQTKTYIPGWYEGKALPIYQSFITVGFELIENGKIVDLSKIPVRWYVDDVLFKNEMNGLGIKKVVVYNQKYGGDISSIKISLPNYKGSILEKTIDVPIKNPEVVIDVPFFEKKIPSGDNSIFAWPFYFNVASQDMIGLQWSAEGGANQVGKIGEAFQLNVARDAVQGTKFTIDAMVNNIKRAAENAIQSTIIETK